MKADDENLQQVLGGEKQYIVPVFQRRYSWKMKQWKDLWRDILNLLENKSLSAEHFVGTYVCMPGEHRPGKIPDYTLIDGQQRIATFTIILCAIRDHAKTLGEKYASKELQTFSREIHNKYLIDEYKNGLEKYKIISRAEDREFLFKILEEKEVKGNGEKIIKSYQFFKKKIAECLDDSPKKSFKTLQRLRQIILQQLTLVMITLDKNENPFAIFETLNERGLMLAESDLIRNYVFMQLHLDEQDKFNRERWVPFENTLKKIDFDAKDLTKFYRDYLMRSGEYVKKNEVYLQFKKQTSDDPYTLVEDLARYANFYRWIHRSKTAPNQQLGTALGRITYLDIGTSYPLLLHLLDNFEAGKLPLTELANILHGLESFVIRRSICGESTRGYYYTFPKAIETIDEENIKDSLFQYLTNKGWPKDEEFKENLLRFKIYTREKKKCRLILETLEQEFGHKEPVQLKKVNIEHIMPRTLNDDEWGTKWREMLGHDWERIHKDWAHCIGNLTLTGYNPELSNRPFEEKKDLLVKSHLDLNNYFSVVATWNENEIKQRGKKLANEIANIWTRPFL